MVNVMQPYPANEITECVACSPLSLPVTLLGSTWSNDTHILCYIAYLTYQTTRVGIEKIIQGNHLVLDTTEMNG